MYFNINSIFCAYLFKYLNIFKFEIAEYNKSIIKIT